MFVVDREDLVRIRDVDLRRLLRWACEEIIVRHGNTEGAYRIEDEVSEAFYITGAKYGVKIEEMES